MSNTIPALQTNGLGHTQRRDKWWIEPLLTALVLTSFGIYATLRAFQGEHYFVDPYLSPFNSPPLTEWFPALENVWHLSPALLILPFPLVFRATCYYYRKAYYRSFFMDPPACGVGEMHRHYAGESHKEPFSFLGLFKMPNVFVLQNLHRYAFYAAAVFILILAIDAVQACFFQVSPGSSEREFGLGVGSLVLIINVLFLSLYTFSCHSWRHLIGGNTDCFSCTKMGETKYKAWSRQTVLNENHMLWAWISLFTVWFSDLYILLLSKGVITDMRLF